MATTISGSERVYLGTLASIDGFAQPTAEAPPTAPASAPTPIENLYSWQIGPTTTQGSEEVIQVRFQLIEVEIVFQGGSPWDSVLVIPYLSRKNPAPSNYGTATDSAADTWGSFGGQTVYRVAGANGGNRFRFAAGGAKYLLLWAGSGSGGSGTRHADALLYGITDRSGGIS